MVMLSTVFFSCYAFVRYLESGIQILRKCCQQLLNTAKKLMRSSTGCLPLEASNILNTKNEMHSLLSPKINLKARIFSLG